MRRAYGEVLHCAAHVRALVRAQVTRGHLQDRVKVGTEAGLEHGVDLIEDDVAHVTQVQIALLDQLEQPAGCRHEQVDGPFELLTLRAVGHAATDHLDAELGVVRELLGHAVHLHRELACGHEHHRARPLGLRAPREGRLVVLDALHRGHEVRERLARARLRSQDETLAPENGRNCKVLQLIRLVHARGVQRRAQLLAHSERSERRRRGRGGGHAADGCPRGAPRDEEPGGEGHRGREVHGVAGRRQQDERDGRATSHVRHQRHGRRNFFSKKPEIGSDHIERVFEHV